MTKRQNTIEIKNKLINHLTIHGKKNESEKILLKSVKELQKISLKSSKKLIQLALVSTTPIFKLNIITQKKRKKKKQKSKIIPAFIYSQSSRISFAIKFIVATARKKKNQTLLAKIPEEILLSAQRKSSAIDTKKDIQKQAFLNRHLFKYYRWR
jgi:small subunit ribosomal protein S7